MGAKRDPYGIASGILTYINDDELTTLISSLGECDIHLAANLWYSPKSKNSIEFYLFGGKCTHKNPYYLGDGDLRSIFLDAADSVRIWGEKNKHEYESFIECFGVGERRDFVNLVDKHLSE